jgi:hypothetical protein
MAYAVLHKRYVFGIFKNKNEIIECIKKLHESHYQNSKLSILVSNPESHDASRFFKGNSINKGRIGSLIGASVGTIIGGCIGILWGARLIPKIDTAVIASPFLSTLGGLFFGAILGSVLGLWIGKKVPEDDSKGIERGLKLNEIMLSVHVDDETQAEQTEQIFHDLGATKILFNEEKAKFSESKLIESRAE